MSANRQPFEQVYDGHFQAIFRYVLRRVADVAVAEDLTAQTFYKALRGFWRFRFTGGNVSAWLFRIATHEVNSHYRARQARPRAEADAEASPEAAERSDAEGDLGRHRLYLDLHRALRELPPDDQALIVLRYFEQKSYAEIAPILGGRPGTLAMRANRALKKLKTELEQRGINHEELRGLLASADRPRPVGRRLSPQAAP